MTREEESVAAIILFSQFRLKWRTYVLWNNGAQQPSSLEHQRPTTNFFTQGREESTTKAHTHTHTKKKKAMSPQKGNTHARALRKKEGDGDA